MPDFLLTQVQAKLRRAARLQAAWLQIHLRESCRRIVTLARCIVLAAMRLTLATLRAELVPDALTLCPTIRPAAASCSSCQRFVQRLVRLEFEEVLKGHVGELGKHASRLAHSISLLHGQLRDFGAERGLMGVFSCARGRPLLLLLTATLERAQLLFL